MKQITTIMGVMALGLSSAAFAQSGDILVTATPADGGTLFVVELVNDGDVVGVQYDINFGDIPMKNIQAKGCLGQSKYAKSQLAGCALRKDGTVRVGIIGEGLSGLATGEIGRIFVSGPVMASKVSVSNTALVSAQGVENRIEALTDFSAIAGKPAVLSDR